MIRRFRHRGLRRLYEHDDRRELNPDHADKIARILARLDEATRARSKSTCPASGCIR